MGDLDLGLGGKRSGKEKGWRDIEREKGRVRNAKVYSIKACCIVVRSVATLPRCF